MSAARHRFEALYSIVAGLGALGWGALMTGAILIVDEPEPQPVLAQCANLYAHHPVIAELAAEVTCHTPDGTVVAVNTTWDCADGRTLWSNPFGWGHVGFPAQPHPPGTGPIPWAQITHCTLGDPDATMPPPTEAGGGTRALGLVDRG